MSDWKLFLSEFDIKEDTVNKLREIAADDFDRYGVYPFSINFAGNACFFIAWDNGAKALFILGSDHLNNKFNGREINHAGKKVLVCPLNNENSKTLRSVFPFTNPSNHRGIDITLGLGDRLGLASQGHLRLLKDFSVFPVLAQQSIRELNLTGRTYEDVLSDASWAVFQEGYTSGFGADGDHLKTADEVKMALGCGYTMITLDCSEHIDNETAGLPADEINRRYLKVPEETRENLESKYLGKEFTLKKGAKIVFDTEEFKKIVLVYKDTITFTAEIYESLIKTCGRNIDFEMSIDETLTPTTPESHYFVASELIDAGVETTSLAPRFCGEFQKGIDYIGDIAQFEKEFKIHAEIADTFGYKVGVHSGSDKFSVFPIIGKQTGGKYHLKTAGTNWLEAVRVIAGKNPSLYRKMHKFAVQNLDKAKKYYHIGASLENVPDIDKMKDSELPGLMDLNDSRQVLHITYGLILLEKAPDGKPVFRDEIYDTLNKYENSYCEALEKHIGRHIKSLGIALK